MEKRNIEAMDVVLAKAHLTITYLLGQMKYINCETGHIKEAIYELNGFLHEVRKEAVK